MDKDYEEYILPREIVEGVASNPLKDIVEVAT
jgi:hypothetical protein